jgi:hypothetical protein
MYVPTSMIVCILFGWQTNSSFRRLLSSVTSIPSHITMFLQPGLREFNSRSRSISPFPSTVGHIEPRTSGLLNIVHNEGVSDQYASLSHARPAFSAGNSFGSWEMSMVSTFSIIMS